MLWDLHIPREKWLNFLQTVKTLIRCHRMRRLIWVCTVCQLPFYGSPDYNGLNKSIYYLSHGISENCWVSRRQCRLWSDSTFCGFWSGSTLFYLLVLYQSLANSAGDILITFFLSFLRKQGFDMSHKFSSIFTRIQVLTCQNMYSGKNWR